MIEALISLAIVILIVGLIVALLVWVINSAPFIAEPFKQWGVWFVYVIAVLIIVAKALPLAGVNI